MYIQVVQLTELGSGRDRANSITVPISHPNPFKKIIGYGCSMERKTIDKFSAYK